MAANPGTILLIGGAALIAFLATRRKPVSAPAGSLCDPGPYIYDKATVVHRIDGYLDSGRRDPATIAVDVSTDLFSPHPTGPNVTFPPVVNPSAGLPLAGVACSFELVSADVLRRMEERGLTPAPDDNTSPVIFEVGDTNMPNYPWEKPLVQKDNYPTPGMFFLVGQETKSGGDTWTIDSGDQIVRSALGSAMAMAGNYKSGWVKPSSSEYNNQNAKRLRAQFAKLIRYSPWNDELYGQTNANYAGGNNPNQPGGEPGAVVDYMMKPCGRGLNFLPRHADQIGRLGQGLGPQRTTTVAGGKLTGQNSGSKHMQLWIPAVNLANLGPNVPDASLTVTTQGLQWTSGDATLVPPPQVWGKGIVNPIGGAAQWGCPGVQ